jgi:phage baseplate assembly protein W
MATITTAEKYTSTSLKPELYSDFSVGLDIHPGKKDLARVMNENATKRSIINLLLTDYDERLYQPNLGANLKYLLFEPASEETLGLMQSQIEKCLSKFEPRINILNLRLSTSFDEQQINVTLVFSMINIPKPITINLILNRVR